MCNLVEPTRQDRSISYRRSLLRQHKKRRLKSVFCVVLVVQDMPTDAKHHRAMSNYESPEGFLGVRLIAVEELLE